MVLILTCMYGSCFNIFHFLSILISCSRSRYERKPLVFARAFGSAAHTPRFSPSADKWRKTPVSIWQCRRPPGSFHGKAHQCTFNINYNNSLHVKLTMCAYSGGSGGSEWQRVWYYRPSWSLHHEGQPCANHHTWHRYFQIELPGITVFLKWILDYCFEMAKKVSYHCIMPQSIVLSHKMIFFKFQILNLIWC